MKVQTALDRYVLQLQANGRSQHTVDQVRRHVGLLMHWGKAPADVRRLTHEHLARFLVSDVAMTRADGQPKQVATTNALRSSMRSFFAYCHAAGYAPRNAAALVRCARIGPRPPRALSEDETERLVAVLDEARTVAEKRDRVLIRLLLATGIRITSALAATTQDLDLRGRVLDLRQMKGGGRLTVPLDSETCGLLAEHVRGLDPGVLFPSRQGGAISRRVAALRFTEWLRRAGITRRASLHSLRHTRATRLYETTGDLLAVQRALGHASVASTAVYARGR